MHIRFSPIALCLAMSLAGCVRTDTEMLDTNNAVISARGSAFDTPATVLKTTLLQAAKLGIDRGFAYFVVVSANDATRTAIIVNHGTTYTTGDVSGNVSGYQYGNGFSGNISGSYSGTSHTTPDTLMTLVKPGSDVVVRFYRESEVDPHAPGIWSVAALMANADNAPVSVPVTSPPPPVASPAAAVEEQPAQRFDTWQTQNRK